jgi:hypothetical protein
MRFHIEYIGPDGQATDSPGQYNENVPCGECIEGKNCFPGQGAATDYLLSLWHTRNRRRKAPLPLNDPVPVYVNFIDIAKDMKVIDPLRPDYHWYVKPIEHIDFF